MLQHSYLDMTPFGPYHCVYCYTFQHLYSGYGSSNISVLKLDILLFFNLVFSYMHLQDYFSFEGLLMSFTKLVVQFRHLTIYHFNFGILIHLLFFLFRKTKIFKCSIIFTIFATLFSMKYQLYLKLLILYNPYHQYFHYRNNMHTFYKQVITWSKLPCWVIRVYLVIRKITLITNMYINYQGTHE